MGVWLMPWTGCPMVAEPWWPQEGSEVVAKARKLEVLVLPRPGQDVAPCLLNIGSPQPSKTLPQVGLTPGAG